MISQAFCGDGGWTINGIYWKVVECSTMPLNMFGIQYSGLSRMHRCGDIFMPQFLSRQKELLCKQSRKLRGCKSYLRLNFVGYKNSSTWYILSCSVLDLWCGWWLWVPVGHGEITLVDFMWKNERRDDTWRLKQEDANCKIFWVKFLATASDHVFKQDFSSS